MQDHVFLEAGYCRGYLPALGCRAVNPYFSSPPELLCSERRLPQQGGLWSSGGGKTLRQ